MLGSGRASPPCKAPSGASEKARATQGNGKVDSTPMWKQRAKTSAGVETGDWRHGTASRA